MRKIVKYFFIKDSENTREIVYSPCVLICLLLLLIVVVVLVVLLI